METLSSQFAERALRNSTACTGRKPAVDTTIGPFCSETGKSHRGKIKGLSVVQVGMSRRFVLTASLVVILVVALAAALAQLAGGQRPILFGGSGI
jgi:hypothetical protein